MIDAARAEVVSGALARRRALLRVSGERRQARTLSRLQVPRATEPRAAMVTYHIALRRVVARLRSVVREILLPDLALWAAPEPPGPVGRMDADPPPPRDRGRLGERLKRAARDVALADATLDHVGNVVVAHAFGEFSRQVRRISQTTRSERAALLSVNAIGQEGMAPLVHRWTRTNADLITSMVGDTIEEIAAEVASAGVQGVRVEELAARIMERVDVSESRAALIARDQVLKLNGDATRERQTSVGITHYTWDTSKDERVRGNPSGKYPKAIPSHYDLDGQTFAWDDPPIAGTEGERCHPGQAIQCRCTARPVIEGLI